MKFSDEQLAMLKAPLNREHVKQREQAGRKLSYVESWHVISEANRVFGFDGWSSQTIDTYCTVERETTIGQQQKPGWTVSYNARVKVTVGDDLVREDVGSGHGISVDLGLAHEGAIKEAVSDAQKRALRMFGSQFGLALYDREQTNVVDEEDVKRQQEEAVVREDFIRGCKEEIERLKDDWPKLHAWWHTPHQKTARSKYLSPAEREEMMLLMLSHKPKEQSEGT